MIDFLPARYEQFLILDSLFFLFLTWKGTSTSIAGFAFLNFHFHSHVHLISHYDACSRVIQLSAKTG